MDNATKEIIYRSTTPDSVHSELANAYNLRAADWAVTVGNPINWTGANETPITTLEGTYAALSSDVKSAITSTQSGAYSRMTTARNEYNAVSPVQAAVAGLPAATLANAASYKTVRTSYNGLASDALRSKVTNSSTLTTGESTIAGLYDTAASGLTWDASSDTNIATLEGYWDNMSATVQGQTSNNGIVATARRSYAVANPVNTQLSNLPSAESITANNFSTYSSTVSSAKTAYNGLANASDGSGALGNLQGKITEAALAKLTAADTKITNLTTASTIASNMASATAALDITGSKQALVDALAAYNDPANVDAQAYVDGATIDALNAAIATYDAVNPVYTAINAISSYHLNDWANIGAAQTAYNALNNADRQAMVDAATTTDIADIVSGYSDLEPTGGLGASLDSSKVTANFAFSIPTAEVDYASGINVSVGGTTSAITSGSSSVDGANTVYSFSKDVAAKEMVDTISYSVTGGNANYKDIYTSASGSTTVQAYCLALINGSYSESVKNVARAMLVYGGAAQNYFNYNNASESNLASYYAGANHTPSAGTIAAVNSLSAFTSGDALVSAMEANATVPVVYTAYNVTFDSNTTLTVAFKVKSGFATNAALNWARENIHIGEAGKANTYSAVSGSKFDYIFVALPNVDITDIANANALTITGISGNYSISITNYIAAINVQASANTAAVALTRGLYEYYAAVNAYVANP